MQLGFEKTGLNCGWCASSSLEPVAPPCSLLNGQSCSRRSDQTPAGPVYRQGACSLGACNPTFTVSVEKPELVTEVVLKLAVAVGGKPPR
jgi:hypothetical protein